MTNPLTQALAAELAAPRSALLGELEELYKDLHRHPELSMQELRTAKIAAGALKAAGFKVTRKVGVTGVVGVLRNGAGPTVMLRADMDALPMAENTGLPYASTAQALEGAPQAAEQPFAAIRAADPPDARDRPAGDAHRGFCVALLTGRRIR